MNKEVLRAVLEKHIDQVFLEFMEDNDIKTGDITPLQALNLDEHLDSLTDLIFMVCEQNREEIKYYTKEEVIKYVKDHNTVEFNIDVGAPRDFKYNEHILEEGEKYSIIGNTISLYLE